MNRRNPLFIVGLTAKVRLKLANRKPEFTLLARTIEYCPTADVSSLFTVNFI